MTVIFGNVVAVVAKFRLSDIDYEFPLVTIIFSFSISCDLATRANFII